MLQGRGEVPLRHQLGGSCRHHLQKVQSICPAVQMGVSASVSLCTNDMISKLCITIACATTRDTALARPEQSSVSR